MKVLPAQALGVGGLLLAAGCATFRARPLPAAPDLAPAPILTMAPERLELPSLAPHPVDPSGSLDETTVVTLAVLNDPDLKARRLQAGVAEAQMLEAGLLPDPVASGALSRSALHGGYDLGIAEELTALLALPAHRAAARSRARQVQLEILWQEWQVAARARELFLQATADDALEPLLTEERTLLAARRRGDATALARGTVTAAVVAADVAALADVETRLGGLKLERNQVEHELDNLLGLQPGGQLRLRPAAACPPLAQPEFRAALAALPRRRADLLALQAGYASQEQRLRAAVLTQFPALTIGVTEGRSAEEGVHAQAIGVEMVLPLFNRNRGQVAGEEATRAQLYQEYQARLDRATVDADQVWRAAQILAEQSGAAARRAAALQDTAAAARASYRRGELTLASYVAARTGLLDAEADAIRFQMSLNKMRVALATLLGLPVGAPHP